MKAVGKVFRKSPIGAFLRLNEWLWDRLPAGAKESRLLQSYGLLVNALVRREANREMSLGTFFLRNRPELRLIANLARAKNGEPLNVSVLGASNGASPGMRKTACGALRGSWLPG